MQRRGFILLEVFITMALISLAVIPISTYPAKIYQKEMAALKKLEREPLYDLAMAHFIKQLTTSLSWDSLEGTHPLENCPSLLQETPYLAVVDVEIEDETPTHRLLKCTLTIDTHPKVYLLHIHKS